MKGGCIAECCNCPRWAEEEPGMVILQVWQAPWLEAFCLGHIPLLLLRERKKKFSLTLSPLHAYWKGCDFSAGTCWLNSVSKFLYAKIILLACCNILFQRLVRTEWCIRRLWLFISLQEMTKCFRDWSSGCSSCLLRFISKSAYPGVFVG